jgi:hypothetical protein
MGVWPTVLVLAGSTGAPRVLVVALGGFIGTEPEVVLEWCFEPKRELELEVSRDRHISSCNGTEKGLQQCIQRNTLFGYITPIYLLTDTCTPTNTFNQCTVYVRVIDNAHECECMSYV